MNERHNRQDPLELLGSSSPPPGWNERIDVTTDTHAASILQRVITNNVVPFSRPRRRLRVVTGTIIVLALGGTAAAAVWGRTPTVTQALSCWSEAASPPAAQVGVRWDGVGNPVDACTPAWNGGELGITGPPTSLDICTGVNDVAVVLPGGGESCNGLGMAAYVPGEAEPLHPTGENGPDLNEAQLRLNSTYNEFNCVAAHEAKADLRGFLDDLGLQRWDIKIAGTTSAVEPCATVSLDETTEAAYIATVVRAD